MELIVNNTRFVKYDECWIGDISILKYETTIEIYSEDIDIALVSEIIEKCNNTIPLLMSSSQEILSTVALHFWGEKGYDIFSFSGIVIGLNHNNTFIDFRLVFHNSGKNNHSDYANWMIDIKDFKIVGCRREPL
jgi:hypothetical protein